MIKNGNKIVTAEREGGTGWAYTLTGDKYDHATIELGNLGLHNACSCYVDKDPKHYPMAWFKRGTTHNCYPQHPSTKDDDQTVDQQFDTPFEALLDYATGIRDEHKDLTDEKISKAPSYNGLKRCARWCDEQKRRGLTK